MDRMVERAKSIAVAAHTGQFYGVGQPYTYHLQRVVNTLSLDLDENRPELLAAAWLHDVLEDTAWSVGELYEEGVDPYVIALVDAVTNQPGKNRAERHKLTYPRIARMPDAVLLKLADRIANFRNCSFMKKGLAEMYLKEQREFHNALYIVEKNPGSLDIQHLGRINYEAWLAWLVEFHDEMTQADAVSLRWERLSEYMKCAWQAGAEEVYDSGTA